MNDAPYLEILAGCDRYVRHFMTFMCEFPLQSSSSLTSISRSMTTSAAVLSMAVSTPSSSWPSDSREKNP